MKPKICALKVFWNYKILNFTAQICMSGKVGVKNLGVTMIDWGRVRELRDEIGAEDFAEVVQLFLEETDEVAEKIGSNMPESEIESALHFLKGSALNLGFRELASLCQVGEKAAALGQFKTIDLNQVVVIYERSKAAFDIGQNAENAA
jgi:histidine phosphotransfer protein HptB